MRIKNLFRNSFFSMLSQFALLILGFFSQRAMNLYMGAELVGMNGVISNVINIVAGHINADRFVIYSSGKDQEKTIRQLQQLEHRLREVQSAFHSASE